MAFNLGNLGAKLKANQKYLIPAAIGGGALGLLVLSQRGSGGGLGSGGAPTGTDDGGGQGGQGDSGIGAALAQLQQQLEKSNADQANAISEIVAGQAGYQDQINKAFGDIVAQVNAALAASQQQVNSAIAGIPQQQYVPGGYGMNGLEGLFAQLPAFNVPQLPSTPIPANLPTKVTSASPRSLGRVAGTAARNVASRVSTYKPNIGASRIATARSVSRQSSGGGFLSGLGSINWNSFNQSIASGYRKQAVRPTLKPPSRKVSGGAKSSGGGGGGLLRR